MRSGAKKGMAFGLRPRPDRVTNAAAAVPGVPRAEWLEQRTLLTAMIFQVDPTMSSVSLSGNAFGISLDEQGGGSLTARYEGTIVADVAADSVKLLGGGNLAAQSKGNYKPGGTAANYAGQAEGPFGIDLGKAAIRGLVLDVTSQDLPLTDGTSFPSTGETLSVKRGTLFYDVTAAGSGDESLSDASGSNKTAAASTVSTAGGTTTLTIPVDFTLKYSDASLDLKGKIVATSVGTGPFVDANGPANSGTGFTTQFILGQDTSVAATDPTLTVADANGASLVSGRVILTNPLDGSAEKLSVATGGTGITASYNSDSGVLTLTGNAPLASYQSVLASLKYANTAADPTTGDRTITITLNDGDSDGPSATSVVSVTNAKVATIGVGANKAVTFTDADGSVTTLSLKGAGTATLHFAGATDQVVGKKGVMVKGSGVALASIEVTGSSLASKLTTKVAGGDRAVTVGGLTSDASLGSVGGKTVDLIGTLDVTGTIATATFRNVTNAALTAGRILKMTVAGAMTGSTVTLTNPFAAAAPSLGALTVAGQITDSQISAPGSIGSVKAAGMVGSQVYAGHAGSDVFPNDATDFTADAAAIGRVTVGSAKAASPTFDGSVVAARNLGKVSLGRVDTDNGGTPFGVTADKIASLAAMNAAGQALKLKKLDDPATLQVTLDATGFTFGDFAIRLI